MKAVTIQEIKPGNRLRMYDAGTHNDNIEESSRVVIVKYVAESLIVTECGYSIYPNSDGHFIIID